MIFHVISVIYSPYLAFLPIIFIIFHYKYKNILKVNNVWNLGLLLLFLWAFIVGLLNDTISMVTSFALLGYYFFSVYLQEAFNEEKKVEKLFYQLFVFTLGSALVGILDYINVISYAPALWKYIFGIRSIDDISEIYRISGTFNNPNLAGTWFASMIMVGVYFFQTTDRKSLGKLVFLASSIIIYIIVLFMTGSRGAFIGFFVGLVLYAYFSGHKKKMLFLMFTLMSGVTLMLFFPEWFPRGDILFSSISDRKAIWENAFQMFLLKPVTGWGIMGIYYADPTVYHYLKVFHAHNIYLTLATTLGIVGLGTFLWMQWFLLQEIRILYYYQSRIVGLLSGIQGIILGQGLFDFTIMSPQVGMLYIGSSAVITGIVAQYKRNEVFSIPYISYKNRRKQKAFLIKKEF